MMDDTLFNYVVFVAVTIGLLITFVPILYTPFDAWLFRHLHGRDRRDDDDDDPPMFLGW